MTNIDRLPLFSAMDLVADAARAVPGYDIADDMLVFRKLQKERVPALTVEQFRTLYAEWCDRYRAKCAQDRERAAQNIVRIADELTKDKPPTRFRCVCGAATFDPADPAFLHEHQPHCQRAGEERIARERQARPR